MEVNRGDAFTINVTFRNKLTDDDGNVTYEPYDLTGKTVMFTMKSDLRQSDSQAVFKKNITSHVDAEAGLTTIMVSHDDSKRFNESIYYYDFQLVQNGVPVSTKPGIIKVIQTVTLRIS